MPRASFENLTTVAPVYDTDFSETILAIDILAPGTLFVIDIKDRTVSYPFTAFVAGGGAYTTFPYRLELRVRQIVGDGAGSIGDGATGTNIALANLRVLH